VDDPLRKRLQVAGGHRRMSIAIYDHALHVIGGGQKYMATMAAALQDRFDVTYLVNKDVDLGRVAAWYGLDLSRCNRRIVPLPFFAKREWIDSGRVHADMDNPFEAVARASADYDVFVNANMLEKVRPLAPISLFVCHFPDVLARAHFAVHEYTLLATSSRYASVWVQKRWGLSPAMLLYPPVDLRVPSLPKERIILSVARFEPSGSKKQLEMIEAFRALREAFPAELAGWRLVLAGGSLLKNPYLRRVRSAARAREGVEVRPDISFDELRNLYARASIFWHACGLGETDPQLVEHFGMTTVEAMQAGCAPVVIDGGGQREIVEHGMSGFRFRALDELCLYTLRLLRDDALRASLQMHARERARRFGRETFEERSHALFDLIHREYVDLPAQAAAQPQEGN
jgi:glycosyltransferase involved in cell wall biosynthesis